MTAPTKERPIAPTYDNRGNPVWKSQMSPPDESVAVINMVPDRIIPVIFVPGVMGSNLIGIDGNKDHRWLLDSSKTMLVWMKRGPEQRKAILDPQKMKVDPGGALPKDSPVPEEELRRRGWGEVGAMSYATFLVWLEKQLNDYHEAQDGERVKLIDQILGAAKGEAKLSRDQVSLSYKYRFPVHACGYNWLDDNAASARTLKTRIEEVITRYRSEKKKCEKVIVVTHSMGGLVARHCSEVLGMSDKILGIVHGVMPSIGAAAVYRRFKSGTEGDPLAAKALGENATEMTAVLSGAPGPLQLLPTPEYGNRWLIIKDKQTTCLLPEKGDPYKEIYTQRGKWWSMCDDQLINPLNKETDQKKRLSQIESDWEDFASIITKQVKLFHDAIKGKYHPNTHAFFGSDDKHKAYGTVTWRGTDIQTNYYSSREGRHADILNAKHLSPNEISIERTVNARLDGDGTKKSQMQSYAISTPDEPGDGTVPHRSGCAPKEHPNVKSMLQVSVGHEPAYKDSELAKRFVLRAIVQIAQGIKETSLHYG